MPRKLAGVLLVGLLLAVPSLADTPDDDDSWNDIVSRDESLVFGRFVGKFNNRHFHSRKIRLREVNTGDDATLEIDNGLGYIVEKVTPGQYEVVGFEATYYPPTTGPLDPSRYRPIRQRFMLNPKAGDAQTSRIVVLRDQPVYIGTIQADNPSDGMVYRGHQLRVLDDFDDAYRVLSELYPTLVGSLERQGIAPAMQFMLRPSTRSDPLARVVGLDDPIRQAREYIADGKFRQAITWLETFMPTSDGERAQAKLLVGEALLGEMNYPAAIEELGDVLLIEPDNVRALRLLARAHAYDGNIDSAQNLYEALARLLPGDAEAHLHLGYFYALRDERDRAREQFRAAFAKDFDYLLHDLAPFYIAVREAVETYNGEYQPPKVKRSTLPPPRGMDSRRQAEGSGFSVLIDDEGKVIAAQIGNRSEGSAPMMMMFLVKATYEPASLNGIPVPALFTIGDPSVSTQ